MPAYSMYGLVVAIPFLCPMLTRAPIGAMPDVMVMEGTVPYGLTAPHMKDRTWQAAPGQFLYRGGPRAGRFLVEDGRRITLERNPGAEDDLLCVMLFTTVMAAMLRQRGLLVLHANVAVTPRGAIAIAGESGAGKSTTQAALLKRGCPMLTDDVTVLKLGTNGRVVALPGVPKMNLCEDAAHKLGHDVENLARNPMVGTKVIVPVAERDSVAEPLPLKALYLISRHGGDVLLVRRLNGAEKFTALQNCIYGPHIPEDASRLFPLVKAVTEQVGIFSLQRPIRGCSIDRVAEAVLHG